MDIFKMRAIAESATISKLQPNESCFVLVSEDGQHLICEKERAAKAAAAKMNEGAAVFRCQMDFDSTVTVTLA